MRRLALVVLAGIAACGIDVVGVDPVNGDGGTVSDGSSGSTVDGGPGIPPPNPACGCSLQAPVGWSLVAFANDRNTPCPTSFDTRDRISSAVAAADACTCGDCAKTLPTCTASTFHTNKDDNTTPTCNIQSINLDTTTPTGCAPLSSALAAHSRVVPPDPVGGSCTAPSVSDPTKVTSTGVRQCQPAGAACACNAGPAFKTCLVKSGDEACPASAPQKTLVADTADVACSACTCTLDSRSCKASVTWFSGSNCTGALGGIDSTQCANQPSGNANSYRWLAEGQGTCTTQPGTGTATLHAPETICCP